jgi:hypothetical protein
MKETADGKLRASDLARNSEKAASCGWTEWKEAPEAESKEEQEVQYLVDLRHIDHVVSR